MSHKVEGCSVDTGETVSDSVLGQIYWRIVQDIVLGHAGNTVEEAAARVDSDVSVSSLSLDFGVHLSGLLSDLLSVRSVRMTRYHDEKIT